MSIHILVKVKDGFKLQILLIKIEVRIIYKHSNLYLVAVAIKSDTMATGSVPTMPVKCSICSLHYSEFIAEY